jgi:phage shock protein A
VPYCGRETANDREGELRVRTRDPGERGDDLAGLWRRVGDHLVRGLAGMDARFDRLDRDVAVLKTDVAVLKTDVAVLKTDVAVLKTDVAETKQQLSRLEQAHHRHADRVEARFDQLVGLIMRDETKGGGGRPPMS